MTEVNKYEKFINNSAKKHGVDPHIIKAIISAESGGNPKAVSGVGAKGLMQLMDGTAKEVGVNDPFDPEQNIEGGTAYYARQLKNTKGDQQLALASYNAGYGNVQKHKGIPPFPETQEYVGKVEDYYKKLKVENNIPETPLEPEPETEPQIFYNQPVEFSDDKPVNEFNKNTELNYNKPEPFTPEWNPKTIKEGLADGRLSEDDATTLLVQWKLHGSLYDLKPEEVKIALANQMITEEQASDYIYKKKHPILWWGSELIKKPIFHGTEKFWENTIDFINEWNPFIYGLKLEKPDAVVPKVDLKFGGGWTEDAPQPETVAGNVVSVGVRVAWALIPATRIVKTANIMGRLFKATPEVAEFAAAHPTFASWFSKVIYGMQTGGVVDAIAFDPHEGRFADFLDEYDLLPEVLHFMTTDPNNPAGWERLKNVVEGAFLGSVFESVMFALGGLKSLAYKHYMGNLDALAHDFNKIPKLSEAMDKAYKAELDAFEKRPKFPKKDEGSTMGGKKIVDSPTSEGVDFSAKRPKTGSDKVMDQKAHDILNDMLDESKNPEFHNNFIKHLESNPSAERLIAYVYDHTEEFIAAETKKQSHKTTKAKSTLYMKKLADVTGNDMDAIQNQMRNIYGEIKGATEKAYTMYRYLTTYSEAVDTLIKNYDGSPEQLLRIAEHLKMQQELQAMVAGVRTESGRLLNMHNMGIEGYKRFDVGDLRNHGDLVDYVQKNKRKLENAMQAYSKMGKAEDKLRFARFLGNGGMFRWILNWEQAALLWNPATHLANIVSQTAAVGFRFTAHGIANSILTGVKMNPVYLKRTVVEAQGLFEALKVSFKGLSKIKGLKNIAKEKEITFAEALRHSKEVGTAWKSFILREGMIDPAISKTGKVERGFASSWIGKIGTTADAITKLPFNLLTGVDEVFKTLGTMSEYNRLLIDEGINKGLKGTELDKWFKASKEGLRPDLLNTALDAGREVTFQQKLGKFSGAIDTALNGSNIGLAVKIAVAPFYKIAVNLVRYAYKNSFLNVPDLVKSLATRDVKALETVTRMGLGTAVQMVAWEMYGQGLITGRAPMGQRDAWRAAGVQEYSYYNTKTREWISYRRLDPFSLWIGTVCDLHMAWDMYKNIKTGAVTDQDFTDVGAALIFSFLSPAYSSTWLKGIGDIIHGIDNSLNRDTDLDDIKKDAIKFTDRFIPMVTALNWYEKEFGDDPYLRDINSMTELLFSKIGKTEDSLPKRDPIYGNPIEREERWMHLINKRTMTEDPAKLEMLRVGCNVSRPKDYLKQNGVKIDLDPKAVDEYLNILSKLPLKDVLNTIVTSEGWKQIGDDKTKADLLRKVVNMFRNAALQMYQGNHPEITDQVITTLQRRALAIAGFTTARDPSTALYNWERYTR